jgi:hypothetical protein
MKITRRPDGRYCATVIRNGQRSFVYGASRREVQAKLVGSISPWEENTETLEHFFSDWLESNCHGWSPKTYQGYEEICRLYIIPHLGHIGLVALSYKDVQKLIALLKKQSLAPRTVQYAVSVLSRGLNWAMKWERVGRNVVKMTNPVFVPRHHCCHPGGSCSGKRVEENLLHCYYGILMVWQDTIGSFKFR